MSHDQRSILVAPAPIEGESPLSWLMRTAARHLVTHSTLMNAVGIAAHADPDAFLSAREICRLSAGTNVFREAAAKLVTSDGDDTGAFPGGRGLLLHGRSRIVTYRFCRSCLAADRIPFLRRCWRLRDWLICPLHREPLATRCPHCGEEISPTAGGINYDESCMGICKLCAGNLADPDIDSIQPTAIYDERTFILQESTYSLATTGTFRVAGIEESLSLSFYYWLRENYRWLEIRAMTCQSPDHSLVKLLFDMLDVYNNDHCKVIRIAKRICRERGYPLQSIS